MIQGCELLIYKGNIHERRERKLCKLMVTVLLIEEQNYGIIM